MNNIKFLSIKGAVLDKNQLENYLEKVASDDVLKKYSDKNTYPIARLKDNFLCNIFKCKYKRWCKHTSCR